MPVVPWFHARFEDIPLAHHKGKDGLTLCRERLGERYRPGERLPTECPVCLRIRRGDVAPRFVAPRSAFLRG